MAMRCINHQFEKRNLRTYSQVRANWSYAAPMPFVLYSDLYDQKQFIREVANMGFTGLIWSPEVRQCDSAEELIRRLQAVVLSPLWYKRMQEKDIKFLAELLNDTKIISVMHNEVKNFADWLETYHNFWKNDRDESHFIVFYDDEPAGWIKINGLESNDTTWISMLVISPSYQKKGIGTNAIAFSENFLKNKGFSKIGIHTTEDNIIARKLYEKCGYCITEFGECTTGDGAHRMGYTFLKNISNTE